MDMDDFWSGGINNQMSIREFLEMCTTQDNVNISIFDCNAEESTFRGTIEDALNCEEDWLLEILEEYITSWDFDYFTREIRINY